jgi:hypothetical protein
MTNETALSRDDGRDPVRVLRWVARIAASLSAALMLLIFVGEGIAGGSAPLLRLTGRETALMVAFAAAWLGLVLGWRWELVGGLLTVGAMVAFYLLDYAWSGSFPRGPYFLLFFSPSLLFLYCGWQTRKESSQR